MGSREKSLIVIACSEPFDQERFAARLQGQGRLRLNHEPSNKRQSAQRIKSAFRR